MKLHKGQLKLVIPEGYAIESVIIYDHNGLAYALQQVDELLMKRFKQEEKNKEGIPIAYCYDGKNAMVLHPRPDKEYPDCRVRYLVLREA